MTKPDRTFLAADIYAKSVGQQLSSPWARANYADLARYAYEAADAFLACDGAAPAPAQAKSVPPLKRVPLAGSPEIAFVAIEASTGCQEEVGRCLSADADTWENGWHNGWLGNDVEIHFPPNDEGERRRAAYDAGYYAGWAALEGSDAPA